MSEELELLKAEGRLGRKAVATFLHDLAEKNGGVPVLARAPVKSHDFHLFTSFPPV